MVYLYIGIKFLIFLMKINEHIKLTLYLKMNVRLAAQVLISTVSKILLAYGPLEAAETANFCSLMDCFPDIMNI